MPFEIAEEKTNTDIETDVKIRPKHIATANAYLMRRLTADTVGGVKKYITLTCFDWLILK